MKPVLLWGAQDDPPVAAVQDALAVRGGDVVAIDREALASLRFDVEPGLRPRGWIAVGSRRIEVDEIGGMFLRPQPQRLPNAAGACLLALASSLPDAVVVNRPAAGRSNLSKPAQLAAIAAAGFEVPETLVTTDPAAAMAFLQRHGRIVYKSISGVRSIVNVLERSDAARLQQVRTGPVQLQRWVTGEDLRVHVVGQRCFATGVHSDAVDYRYGGAELVAAELGDAALEQRLRGLAEGMGLLLAGIDLRRTPDGHWICFEVNPAPGFSFYEDATGQPIAGAVAELLLGGA